MSLILNNVSYIYYPGTPFERKALNCISCTIEKGDFIGLAGYTGSGKSTLLRILKGLVKPSEGTITNTEHEKAGLVFQYPENQLFEETVLKDVMFGPVNTGYSREEAERLSVEALKEMGLDESFFERSPLSLSGGEKRMVAIAGILSMNVDILLLDEPDAGLDALGREKLFTLLKELNEQGKTIVMVSHNMDHINKYCNKAVVLKDGSVAEFGKPSDLEYCKTDRARLLEKLACLGL